MKTQEIVRDMTLPIKAKQLLKDREIKKITMEEFLQECAYWSLGYIKYYGILPMPTPPKEILELRERLRLNSTYETKSEFWKIPHIQIFVESSRKIEGRNLGNYLKLKEILKNLPEADTMSRNKVLQVIETYSQFVMDEKRFADEQPKEEFLEEVETEFWG